MSIEPAVEAAYRAKAPGNGTVGFVGLCGKIGAEIRRPKDHEAGQVRYVHSVRDNFHEPARVSLVSLNNVGRGEALDNAGWHVTEKIKPPEGLILRFVLAYTPEIQPAERLWPMVNEAVVNTSFPTLENLAEPLAQRCRELCNNTDLIHRHTLFHWWPRHAWPEGFTAIWYDTLYGRAGSARALQGNPRGLGGPSGAQSCIRSSL